MIGTKERIWRTALDLFAQKGFEATSVSDLAGRLGLSKGALYKHFADKRAILEEITRQMAEQDSLAAQKYAVPEETFSANPASYAHTELSQAIAFTKAQFGFWALDEVGAKFRRLLIIEQYGSAEFAELYENYLGRGPLLYMQDIFQTMIEQNKLAPAPAPRLAVEFYAPFMFLLSQHDRGRPFAECLAILNDCLDSFAKRYDLKPNLDT